MIRCAARTAREAAEAQRGRAADVLIPCDVGRPGGIDRRPGLVGVADRQRPGRAGTGGHGEGDDHRDGGEQARGQAAWQEALPGIDAPPQPLRAVAARRIRGGSPRHPSPPALVWECDRPCLAAGRARASSPVRHSRSGSTSAFSASLSAIKHWISYVIGSGTSAVRPCARRSGRYTRKCSASAGFWPSKVSAAQRVGLAPSAP